MNANERKKENIMKNTKAAAHTPHQTQVSTRKTIIKMIDANTDAVLLTNAYGKLTVIDCKNIAAKQGCIYISKELIEDTFYVDTRKLINLKEVGSGKWGKASPNDPYTETTVDGFRYIENDDGSNDAHPDCIAEEWRRQMDKDD